MEQPTRLTPDLKYVKELQSVGGDTLKVCYQCATCSVACPISPADNPFPRKEMVWAQWGLKDKLDSDIDIWLCHQCGQCSDLCPRGAKPADILGALRNMTYRKLAGPKILGTWLSSAKYLPIVAGIPALIYLVIWWIRAQQLGSWLPLKDGEVIYGHLFPGDYTIDPIFGLAAIGVIVTFVIGIKRLFATFADVPRTFHVGEHGQVSWMQAIKEVIVDQVLTHVKWRDCSSGGVEGDKTKDRQKFLGHLTLFYAFVALFIVTSVIAVSHWGGKVFHFLEPYGHTPMELDYPVKILANLGAIALLVGLTLLTKRRVSLDEKKFGSSYYDWFLLGDIWLITLTGIGAEILRLANIPTLAYPVYYVHLVSVFMLIAYVPWSKLGHLVYRTAALVYARRIGRVPMQREEEKIFIL
jgi:quinone-modifying oxidoreductase subunit QmoC